MKSILQLIGISGLVVFAGIRASAAPANDNFFNAITLTGPIVTTTGNNVGASKNFGQEPTFVGGDFGGASVWWLWTATASGLTTIDTEGSDFDTLLGVFTGTVPNQLVLVADNNNFNGNSWSRVQFNAVAGTTYRIYVDGFRIGGGQGGRASQGNITLHVKGVGGLALSPTNGTVFTVGDPIPIDVTTDANFPNPPASRVSFYVRGSLLTTVSNAPFSAVASNLPPGSNALYVVAYDSLGNSIQSSVVNILVQNIGVTLLTPSEDAYFLDNSAVTASAWGFVPGGSITNIEFFVDGVKFGEDSTAPFSGTWSNSVGGSHRLTAVGRSDTGARFNSQPVNIGVLSTFVATGAVWNYLDNGTDQGTAWYAPSFDDSAWKSGPAELGYGDGDEATVVEDNATPGYTQNANDRYITTYFRRTFVVNSLAGLTILVAALERDDAGVVYLNGREVFRSPNLPAAPTNITYLTTSTDGTGIEDTIDNFTLSPTNLVVGTNVFAVEIHQQAANSSDISFNFQLLGVPTIIHNLSPTVALTAPTNNFFALAPPTIDLSATAADADGSVAKVEYYADGVIVAESTNTDYSAQWFAPPVGPHSVTAVAVDDLGARTESEAATIMVYDAVGTPFAQITSPKDGTSVEGGTNQLITAFASAQNGVANVQFLSDGAVVGEDATNPFGVVWNAPFGTNLLSAVVIDANGVRGTSAVVRLIAYPNTLEPRIATSLPAPSATLTNLASITVVFTEPVQNVDAGDLLLNGIPATGVTGGGSDYVFTFPQPLYGPVAVTWAYGHDITDFGFPANLPFNGSAPDAQWGYTLIDRTPPTIAARTPASGSTVTNLAQISVTFSESVTNVDATDLLVNGTPAQALSGSGSNYTFSVVQPAVGTVNITWATNHGIFDLAETPNAFNRTSGAWSFTLDTRVVLVQSNSNWRFVKGLAEASDPMDAWRQPAFDDSSWSNSQAPFFFGDPYTNYPAGIFGTLLSDMQSNYTTIYLRKEFSVESRGAITSLLLNHQSDDGFIAWLNGVEVWRYNVPSGVLPYTATASTAANEPNQAGAAYIVVTMTNSAVSRLVNGRNVLAIQAFNQNLTNSSDFGFNAQFYYFPVDATAVAPRLVSSEPAAGDLFYLTNVTINFSEGISGVDAGDLLVNGVPATGLSSTTNATYAFSFPQPAYGPVLLTWATNHGIADFDSPPKSFDGAAASARISYTLLNPSSPRVATQTPLAGTTVTGLTSIALSFTEPVAGVDASDLLINGTPASTVSTADNTAFVFSFLQPAFGPVAIRWASNHGITDREDPPAPFDPTRFGGQWNYTLIDPVPAVTITSPTNNTYVLPPGTISLRATATDNDGTVELVEYYSNGSKLGEAASSPYALTVSNVPLGTYILQAVATDNSGLHGTSAPVGYNVVTNLPITLVRGPYLQMGSPTGSVVRFRTDLFSDAFVFYGTDPTSLTNVAVQTMQTNEHIVAITGLDPDTQYFYSVGSGIQRVAGTNGVGSDYWFRTSPLAGTRKPVRVWVVGDAGTAGNGSPERQESTRDAYYTYAATNRAADLFLMLGDNAYNSGQDSEYQVAVFDMYPSLLRNKHVWPTIGNHESNQSTTANDYPYLNMFSLPHNGEAGGMPSGTQKYYSFDYANVHFLCLDSETSGYTTNSVMYQWMQDDLGATTAEWVIAYFHHPPYTHGTHNSDNESDLVQIRQNWVPVLEAYGVDIVLNGHSHVHERSYLLDGHYGTASTFTDSMKVDGGDGREDGTGAYRKNDEGRGVVYNVAGSSGQALGGTLDHPAHFLSLNELGSLVIDVVSNRLDVRFLTTTPGLFSDHYTLTKPEPIPSAPLDLVAIPTGSADITLAWTPVSRNQLGYSIERSLDGLNFTALLSAPAHATNALDSGLVANTTYFYRVRATNAVGLSDYSNIASATSVMPTSVPRAPAGLAASSDNGVVYYRSQMIVSWQDRSTNEGAFQIERSLDGVTFAAVATVGANVTHYLDHHLASATPFYYRVRALNALGTSAPTAPAGDVTHPQSQLAVAGTRAIFHAGVEGDPPVSYQWRFLDADIPGATNESLVLDSAQPADEGDYSVVVTDATRHIISNPAYLFVLTPPRILVQPQDGTNTIGASTSLTVVADGSAPFTYHWRKNGVLIEGANSPTLFLANLQFSDRAGYDVIVENEFGSVTSRAAQLYVYALPTLASASDLVAEVLRPVTVTNVTTDSNVPPLTLNYSLASGAPTNASINATNGIFRWTPNRAQGGTTNLITVRVQDPTRPILSNATSFTVYVNDFVEISPGSTVLRAGLDGAVPIDFFSSMELLGLECAFSFPGERLTNLTVEALAPEIAEVSLLRPDSNTAGIVFTALPGHTLQGTQHLARLRFTAVTNQTSAFVPLRPVSMEETMAQSQAPPTELANDGRVVVVGTKSLLEVTLSSTGVRGLTLYGTPATYTLQQATNIANPVWTTRTSVPITGTNLSRSIGSLGVGGQIIYYRARQP